MKNNRKLYYVEITDTYGGEPNFNWITRHIIRAKTERGAIQALAYRSGINWRKVYDTGDHARYDSRSGVTCAFIADYRPTETDYSYCRFDTDDRLNGE